MMFTMRWQEANLTEHLQKRLTVDRDCINAHLRISPFTRNSYVALSTRVLTSRIAEYQAESRRNERDHSNKPTYNSLRLYYVDENYVLVISNINRTVIITCYHYHGKYKQLPDEAPAKQKVSRFKENLEHDIRRKKLQNCRLIYAL